MNLKEATAGRRIAAKTGTWIFLLFFWAVLDAIISQTRLPLNHLHLIPGATEKFNFTLREPVANIEALSFQTDTRQMRVSFESIHKGFFLGGEMARGVIIVEPKIAPGTYRIHMGQKERLPEKFLVEYLVHVYPSMEALRQNSLSFFQRNFNLSPWSAAFGFLILLVISMGVVYYYSSHREALLSLSGKADIYRIKRYENFYEVAFGLGYDHGLESGMRVKLLDKEHRIQGEAEVKHVFPSDAFAIIPLTQRVEPGYMIDIKS